MGGPNLNHTFFNRYLTAVIRKKYNVIIHVHLFNTCGERERGRERERERERERATCIVIPPVSS